MSIRYYCYAIDFKIKYDTKLSFYCTTVVIEFIKLNIIFKKVLKVSKNNL